MTVSASSIPNPTTITPSVQTATGATGANVLFQHGIFSNGGTWNRMEPWLESDFQFKNVLTSSLNSTDHIATQTNPLISLVQGTGVTNNLVIGHSQGGLIGRSVAQHNSSLFYGVAQLDSPNTGVLLLYNGMQDIDNALVNKFDNILYDAGCASPYDSPWCFIAYLGGYYGIPVAVSYGFDASIPATTDLQIGSSYLNSLNSTTEKFPRVGISGDSDKRWVLFRLAGDSVCYPDDDTCGGRVVADYAEYAYDTLWALWAYYTFVCDPNYYDCADAAAEVMFVINDMDDLDNFWNDLTAGSDASDGIVQGASQTYPNATQNYVISGADTHVGATRSPLDRAMLDTALSQQFFTPPSGCSFTASASPTSFPFYGGQIAITVTGSPSNATTCSVSAVSNAPWMEAWGSPYVTYRTSTNPITLTWIADINLGQDTRTGTLSVGGNTITITQSGVQGTVSTGSVALSGTIPERRWDCASSFSCPAETIAIIVNGATVSTNTIGGYYVPAHIIGWLGPTDNNLNIDSSAIATTINGDANSPVYAGLVGPVVYLVSKTTNGANYTYSASVTACKNPSTCFATVTTAGPTMTGSQ
jgi:pimeloyl-ACP methyl ester carboxylesterase